MLAHFLREKTGLLLFLVGTVLSVVLMIVAAVLSTPNQALLFWIGAYLMQWAASYLLWRRGQHAAKTASQTEATKLEKQMTELQTRIRELGESNAKLQSQLDTRANKKVVKEKLGEFMKRGQELLTMVRDESFDLPQAESQAFFWGMDIEGYLAEQLDKSYVPRLQNRAGLPALPIPTQSEKQREVAEGIHTRLCRLEQFITELGAG